MLQFEECREKKIIAKHGVRWLGCFALKRIFTAVLYNPHITFGQNLDPG